MKKNLMMLLGLLLTGSLVSGQNLDEVLQSYFKANGQDKVLTVNSMKVYGKMIQDVFEIPFIQIAARPANIRVEASLQGLTLVQTFDGKEGWIVNPFGGATEPQPMPEDMVKGLKYQSDMDGMLWKWKEKGYTVTLDGQEEVEGTNCYKVKIITPEGDIFINYIDSDSYMQIRTHSVIKVQGNVSESDSYYSNYFMAHGLAIPGKVTNLTDGQITSTIVSDSVQINVKLDPAMFSKPGK